MPAICLYFQIHQPRRLRHYSVFDSTPDYFDDAHNAEVLCQVAQRSYEPVLGILRRLVAVGSGGKRGDFKFALSLSGITLEAFARYTPKVVEELRALAQTGRVEFLAETAYHSLAALYSPGEFAEQVGLQRALLQEHLGVGAKVFRNTELILDNQIAQQIAKLGFIGTLGEGWSNVAGKGSGGAGGEVSGIFGAEAAELVLLLRNYTLSDDIAFRFSREDWPEWPLTAEKFAQRVGQLQAGPVCNLFMDFETFGEHQHIETGILDFLEALPGALGKAGYGFVTPTELIEGQKKGGGKLVRVDVPRAISWADEARDLSAWLGNAMQTNSAQELYKLEGAVKKSKDPELLADWRYLTTSDHGYYMSTKRAADGQVHAHFSPYESPYDAYINFMNVLDNVRMRARK